MTFVKRLFEIKTRGDLERLRFLLLGMLVLFVLILANFTSTEDFADPMASGIENAVDTTPERRVATVPE